MILAFAIKALLNCKVDSAKFPSFFQGGDVALRCEALNATGVVEPVGVQITLYHHARRVIHPGVNR